MGGDIESTEQEDTPVVTPEQAADIEQGVREIADYFEVDVSDV